jgi:LEA14-like dessication related protein
MDNAKKIKWILGLTMVGIAGVTVNYLMKQVRLLVNTEFTMVGTRINKISLKEINITLWWKVVNKSDISITISEQVYNVYLNDKLVNVINTIQPIVIAPHADTRIPTNIIFTPKDVAKIGISSLASFITKEGREKLNLQVKGTMDLQTSIFKVKKFPIEFEDTIENIMNY